MDTTSAMVGKECEEKEEKLEMATDGQIRAESSF